MELNGSDAMRFWAKADMREGGCWRWTASTNAKGYGKFSVGGRGQGWQQAHRVSWMLAHGEIPDGLCVLHRCDNPPCVNPDHLFLGDIAMNNADMLEKGRRFHRPNVKLTEAQVREIKYRLALGVRLDRLARDFGVTNSAIASIRDGRTWVGVDP